MTYRTDAMPLSAPRGTIGDPIMQKMKMQNKSIAQTAEKAMTGCHDKVDHGPAVPAGHVDHLNQVSGGPYVPGAVATKPKR